MMTRFVLCAATAMLAAACSSGPGIQSEHSPDADFSKYTSYGWIDRMPADDTVPHARLLDDKIRHDVDQELASRGLHRATMTFPDLLVSYSAVSASDMTYGAEPSAWSWGKVEEVFHAPAGSLTLVFTDAKTKQLVWQGMAQDVIGGAGTSDKEIAKAVKELIKRYP